MKSLEEQIKFIDIDLLPLFGFNSICDYETVLYLDELDKKIDIVKINNLLKTIKSLFPVKNFNFHKINNEITTTTHALNVLKKCLEISLIPFEYKISSNRKYVRLISNNIFLHNYIIKKQMESSDIRNSDINFVNHLQKPNIAKETMQYEDMKVAPKKEHTINLFYNVCDLYDKSNNVIKINLDNIIEINKIAFKNIKINISSEKDVKMNFSNVTCYIGSDNINKYKMNNFKIGEYLFNSNFIFPLKCVDKFCIILGDITNIDNVDCNVYIQLEIKCVEFYTDFNARLVNCMCFSLIEIALNDNDIIRISNNNFVFLKKYSNVITSNDFLDESAEMINHIEYNEITLKKPNYDIFQSDYKCLSLTNNENLHTLYKYAKFSLLVKLKNCDVVSYNIKNKLYNYYVIQEDSSYYHKYTILNLLKDPEREIYGDTISNIKITGFLNMSSKKSSKNNIYFYYKSLDDKSFSIPVVIETIADNISLIKTYDNSHYCNLVCSSFSLEIKTKSIENPLSIDNIEFESFCWHQHMRRLFASYAMKHIDFS